jgi:hypothetical protein
VPGRVLGFWLSLAGIIFAAPFSLPAFIVAVVGLSLSVRALRLIPAKHRDRRLTAAAIAISAAAILLVVVTDLAMFLNG